MEPWMMHMDGSGTSGWIGKDGMLRNFARLRKVEKIQGRKGGMHGLGLGERKEFFEGGGRGEDG